MQWGQLEITASADDDPFQRIVESKIEQIQRAQDVGVLERQWEATDILMFVSQLATSWAGQGDLLLPGVERDAFLASRRQAIEAAVRRLFPSRAN